MNVADEHGYISRELSIQRNTSKDDKAVTLKKWWRFYVAEEFTTQEKLPLPLLSWYLQCTPRLVFRFAVGLGKTGA